MRTPVSILAGLDVARVLEKSTTYMELRVYSYSMRERRIFPRRQR